tara:strand:+ start:391 stop:1047 length:657 start_codon:yes stop_codon:yes gene_type:complete
MEKKTLLQLSLFIILLLSSYLFYQEYFKNIDKIEITEKEQNEKININEKNDFNKKKNQVSDVSLKEKNKNSEESSNILKNIKYVSKDESGVIYEIFAEEGKIETDSENLTSMKNVKARIILTDTSIIKIKSNYAIYNRNNYNTNFSGKIKINYLFHNITCEKMDILFDKELAALYENIIYINKKTILKADRMEIDLQTKNSKIFMFNNNEKVSIVSIN